MDYLTVSQAAELLGASPSLIQKRCKDGSIPCIRVGKQYRITRLDLEAWSKYVPDSGANNNKPGPDEAKLVFESIDRWLAMLAVTEKAPTTIANYRAYVTSYIKRLAARGIGVSTVGHLFKRELLLIGFESMVSKSRSLKYNTVVALTSFGKYLVSEGKLAVERLDTIREFKPSRGSEPRRTSLQPADLPKLFAAIACQSKDPIENMTVAAMVGLMLYAGMRVSEVCTLQVDDVRLEEKLIRVRLGKGRKQRLLGIRNELGELLRNYLEVRPELLSERGASDPGRTTLLLRRQGGSWNKDRMARRMKKLASIMGVDITCHGLRRTFATHAVAQGKSVNFVRIALGHTSLAATEAYLRTTETEVSKAMQTW